jgi:hypothetical protein
MATRTLTQQDTVAVQNAAARTMTFRAYNILALRFHLWALLQLGPNPKVTLEPPLPHLEKMVKVVSFQATVKEFAEIVGVGWYQHRLKEIGEAVKTLADVGIMFPDDTQPEGYWVAPACAAVRVPVRLSIENSAEQLVIVKFNPLLFEYFRHHPEGYTLLQVGDIFKVQSTRAADLILLLSYMRHLTSARLRTFTLAELRFSLGLESRAYDRWDNVAAELRKARTEVLRRTRWLFTFEPIKEKGRVVAVRFTIQEGVRYSTLRKGSTPVPVSMGKQKRS